MFLKSTTSSGNGFIISSLFINQLLEGCEDVAENIVLALSIVTLFILCEPRNKITITSMEDPSGYRSDKYTPIPGTYSVFNYSKVDLCPDTLIIRLSVATIFRLMTK